MNIRFISIHKHQLLLIIISLFLFACSEDENESLPNDENNESEVNNPETAVVNVERMEAMALYDDYYRASEMLSAETDWENGDVLNCQSGTIPATILDKVLKRLLYFRKASGVHNTITINAEKSAKAQEAALIMKANPGLSHSIDASWECYSEAGEEGARNSNLAKYSSSNFANAVNAIDKYISDTGASNFGVGHRRWLLWPRLYEIGVGGTDSTNALWVIGNAGPRLTEALQFIAWPPAGYVPSNLIFDRWSFSLHEADFSQTSLKMTNSQGEAISLTVEELSDKSVDNTIVWVPENVDTRSNVDVHYTVKLENVLIDNETHDFEYTVILIDTSS